MQSRPLGGAYYFLLFVNGCIRFTWVYFLNKKAHNIFASRDVVFHEQVHYGNNVDKNYEREIPLLVE